MCVLFVWRVFGGVFLLFCDRRFLLFFRYRPLYTPVDKCSQYQIDNCLSQIIEHDIMLPLHYTLHHRWIWIDKDHFESITDKRPRNVHGTVCFLFSMNLNRLFNLFINYFLWFFLSLLLLLSLYRIIYNRLTDTNFELHLYIWRISYRVAAKYIIKYRLNVVWRRVDRPNMW